MEWPAHRPLEGGGGGGVSDPHAPSLTGNRSKCHPRRPRQTDANRVGIPYA